MTHNTFTFLSPLFQMAPITFISLLSKDHSVLATEKHCLSQNTQMCQYVCPEHPDALCPSEKLDPGHPCLPKAPLLLASQALPERDDSRGTLGDPRIQHTLPPFGVQ